MLLSVLKPLFPEVPLDAVAAAASRFYVVEAGRGVTIIEEGEQDSAVLFLVEGNVAIRTGKSYNFDGEKCSADIKEAAPFIRRTYRKGWDLIGYNA